MGGDATLMRFVKEETRPEIQKEWRLELTRKREEPKRQLFLG